MPKALSALAVSDSDEEDQESTPVIINGDSAGSSAKPTAPMPESSADNGKSFPSYFSIYRTRAIITRGLYIFYPLFEVQKRFFKELFS